MRQLPYFKLHLYSFIFLFYSFSSFAQTSIVDLGFPLTLSTEDSKSSYNQDHHAAFDVPPPDQCLLSSTTLEQLIECMFCHMPGRDSEGYRVPSPGELADWEAAITHMLNLTSLVDCNSASLVGGFLENRYSMEVFMDAINNKEYCVLIETSDDDLDGNPEAEDSDNIVAMGWGTFIVDIDPDRELCIQIPHPDNEEPTARQGVCIFKGVAARSYLVAGADRRANRQCSDIHCDGCSGMDCGVNCDCVSTSYNCPCNGNAAAHDSERNYRISDVTHTNNNPFHRATIALHNYYTALPDRDWVALQFHGKNDTTCASASMVISEGVDIAPMPGDKILDLIDHLDPPWVAGDIQVSDGPGNFRSCLLGTRNPQGHILNGLTTGPNHTDAGMVAASSSTGRFIHIEQNRDYRCPENWIYAIKKTWKPVDVMLVLDLSGSMNNRADPSCVMMSCPTKLDVLKNAVEEFIDVWMLSSDEVTNDRFGVTYFRSNVGHFQSGDLLSFPDSFASISNHILAQNAQFQTAMGGGLQRAINLLNGQTPVPIADVCTDPPVVPNIADCYHLNIGDATPDPQATPSNLCNVGALDDALSPRHIILFTDGRQNRSPIVEEVAPDDWQIVNSGSYSNSNVSAEMPPTELNNNLGVYIHTIATTVPDAYTPLLESIATSTGGAFNNTSIATMLPGAFYSAIVTVLENSSPQLIDYRYGTTIQTQTVESFEVNSGVRKLILKLSWDPRRPLDFEVYKNGVKVSAYGRFVTRKRYKIFVLDVRDIKGSTLSVGGNWELRITGSPESSYEAAAIVDEHSLKYDFSLGKGRYTAGEPITLTADISHGGQPITDAKVTATISRPQQSLGTLCAIADSPTAGTATQTGATADCDEKLEALLQDPAKAALLNPVLESITLQHDKDGLYTAKFLKTEVPGPYTVKFQFTAQGAKSETIQRIAMRTTSVTFGQADLAASALKARTTKRIVNGRYVTLTMKPKDKSGNYLGPGYKDKIEIELNGKVLKNEIQDSCDGRYSTSFFVSNRKDTQLKVSILGNEVFNGALSELE